MSVVFFDLVFSFVVLIWYLVDNFNLSLKHVHPSFHTLSGLVLRDELIERVKVFNFEEVNSSRQRLHNASEVAILGAWIVEKLICFLVFVFVMLVHWVHLPCKPQLIKYFLPHCLLKTNHFVEGKFCDCSYCHSFVLIVFEDFRTNPIALAEIVTINFLFSLVLDFSLWD